MSLSLRSLSSHHHRVHVQAPASSPSSDTGGLDDALNAASTSDPASADSSSSSAIDASSSGQPSNAFAALLNQLLTDGLPSTASATGNDNAAASNGTTGPKGSSHGADPSATSLDALLQALTAVPTGSA